MAYEGWRPYLADVDGLSFQQQHHRELRRLGTMLAEARKAAGLRQVDVAARLARSQSYVTKYEAGERRLDLFELRQVCEALGLPLREVVSRFSRA